MRDAESARRQRAYRSAVKPQGLGVNRSKDGPRCAWAPPAVAHALAQAYLETEYRVLGEPPFGLRVGRASAELLYAHERQKVDCSAFVTACNPFSRLLDDAANAARQRALAGELTHRRLAFVQGIGQHPSNQWPSEESFLVFGLTLEAAKTLGARLQQNALIWSGRDAVPQLILLR